MAYLAYYLHWPHAQLLALDHVERRVWVDQVARINRQLNEEAGSGASF